MTPRMPAVKQTTVPQAPRKTRKRGITKRVHAALEHMVFGGLKRAEAAKEAGLKDNSLYIALRRPEVKAEYLALCEVLRVSGKARRILRLEELAEQDDNRVAAVNAVRALESLGEDEAVRSATAPRAPGIVIQIVAPKPVETSKLIDITPVPAPIGCNSGSSEDEA